MEPRICSLFAGAGGIDIAFRQAGCKTVWANENDREACMTYHLNFPDIPLDERDIRKVRSEEIPDFDILTGGFPCQPFSKLGKQMGFEDDRGNLFFEICRIIDTKRPRVLFLENVANLVAHDNGNTFRIIREEIQQRGYTFEYLVADACDYGFPQHRTRTYIVCFSDKITAEQFRFPEKSELCVHTWDIIDHKGTGDDKRYLSAEHPRYSEIYQAIKNDRLIYRFSDEGVITGYNGICFTLLAGMGNWHDREPIIKDTGGIRKLSPAECFQLMGFPDVFKLEGIPEKGAYRQAGNSVCVPVVKQIADKIVIAIQQKQYYQPDNQEPDTIIGVLKSKDQLTACLKYNFYHFPKEKAPDGLMNIKFIALNQTSRIFGPEAGIRYYGLIKDIRFLPRSEIRALPKLSKVPYCMIEVEKWVDLNDPVKRPYKSPVSVCYLEELIQ